MRHSVSSVQKNIEQKHPAWSMGYVVTPNMRAPRSVTSVGQSRRREAFSLRSSFADVRDALIANIDPIPSANNNLLFVRGLFSTAAKTVREKALPRVTYAMRIATQVWPRIAERKIAQMPNPLTISLLVAFEASILWCLAVLAMTVPTIPTQPVEHLLAAL